MMGFVDELLPRMGMRQRFRGPPGMEPRFLGPRGPPPRWGMRGPPPPMMPRGFRPRPRKYECLATMTLIIQSFVHNSLIHYSFSTFSF